MFNYKTLTLYLVYTYLKYFISTIVILSLFFVVSTTFDVIQQFKNYDISLLYFLRLISYKIPFLLNEIAGLISFITTLFFINKLCKFNELIIILSNGISYSKIVWKIIFINLLLGIIFTVLISPLATYGLKASDKLQEIITNKKNIGFALLTTNILFFEEYLGEKRVIKAQSLNFENNQLNNIVILFLDQNNFLKHRTDAKSAVLEQGIFKLKDARIITNNSGADYSDYQIPTNLSIRNFANRFLPPQKIYIWNFPEIIESFLKSGLPIIDYKTYYYKQLFKFLIMVAMGILASCFLNLNQRNNYQIKLLIMALVIGLLTYLSLEVILRIFISIQIDPILAILLPILLIISISNFVILHF